MSDRSDDPYAQTLKSGSCEETSTTPPSKALPSWSAMTAHAHPQPSTQQLMLAAREAAESVKATAAATGALQSDGIGRLRSSDTPLRLPYLRQPNKEPHPSDHHIAIRLGAFLARGGEESLQKLLQKEFPEPSALPRRLLPSSLSSLPFSSAPGIFAANAPFPTRWPRTGTDGVIVSGSISRSRCRTSRRLSPQLDGRGDCLPPLPSPPYVTESGSGFERFKRMGKLVQIVIKVCNLLKRFVDRHDSDSWSSVEMYLHFEQRIKDQLAFNPKNFAKAQPLNGGPRLQKLLAVPSHLRTSEYVKKIIAIVRSHRGFSDFPLQVQIQLCRCMQYELYEPRRLLLRQGHRPTAFYLLLTGSLMVNIRDTHPATGQTFIRTVSDLRQGDCFGELALLEQTSRTATLICKSQTELASVAKEDFDTIIRCQLLKQRDQSILLCRKHLLFRNFPCEVFYENPDGFFFQYVPAETVVAKNGQECAYIIFVKSGKCRVISKYSTSELFKRQLVTASREAQMAFPLYAAIKRQSQSSSCRPATHPETRSLGERMEVDLLEEVLNRRSLESVAQANQDLEVRVKERPEPPPRPPLKKSRTLSHLYDSLEKEWRQDWARDPTLHVSQSFWGSHLRGPPKKHSRTGTGSAREARTSGQNVKRLEFLRPDRDGHAQIAQLGAGDVFGLETLVRRPKSLQVSVVSDGAELIFISKKLFLQKANIRVLRIVNDMMIQYPSANEIHDQLEKEREWSRYKSAQVRRVVIGAGRKCPPTCIHSSS